MEPISAEEFDRIFDEGKESIVPYLDLSTLRRLGDDRQLVTV